ncbi:hypothetical protein ACFYM3_14485 [Streptomyces massasporeus]|uniref:Secreted protein n=2 Tax=Streptomyces massasporeus TaxID=67324 RepID=A0ABW6LFL8_9ACTN
MSKKLISMAAVTGVAAAAVLVPVGSAGAAPLICDPGSKTVKWVTTGSSRVLTHKVESYEKGYSGGSRTVTKTLTHEKTITSGRSISGGAAAGFGVKKVLTSLDAHVEGAYTHEKAKTRTKSVTISDTLTKKGDYFFYRGTVKATGTWQGFRCDRGTKWIEQTWGKAQSFSAQVDGAVRCGDSVRKKSLARLVQDKYC